MIETAMNPSSKTKWLRTAGLLASATLISICAEGKPSWSGRYVLIQRTVSTTHLPIINDVVAETVAVAILDLTHEGNEIHGAGELCDLAIESTSSVVTTTFPDAFLKALPTVRLDAYLEERGGRPFLVARPETLVLGARLDNPEREPLPHQAEDARVFDQDRDGHPGMTVEVSGLVSGEVYVVQRSKTQINGPQDATGFSGGIHFELEQHVIGASKSVLRHGPNPRADSSRSRFRLIKVAPNTACPSATARARRLR